MIDINQYFNFSDIYFNEIIGDVWLGILIGLIVILIISIKNKIPSNVIIMLCMVWLGAVFATYTSLLIIWVFMVLAVATLFYYSLTKVIQR